MLSLLLSTNWLTRNLIIRLWSELCYSYYCTRAAPVITSTIVQLNYYVQVQACRIVVFPPAVQLIVIKDTMALLMVIVVPACLGDKPLLLARGAAQPGLFRRAPMWRHGLAFGVPVYFKDYLFSTNSVLLCLHVLAISHYSWLAVQHNRAYNSGVPQCGVTGGPWELQFY